MQTRLGTSNPKPFLDSKQLFSTSYHLAHTVFLLWKMEGGVKNAAGTKKLSAGNVKFHFNSSPYIHSKDRQKGKPTAHVIVSRAWLVQTLGDIKQRTQLFEYKDYY